MCTESIRNAISKLESQVCRDRSLPVAYRQIVNQAFDNMSGIDRLVANLCDRHLAVNLCSVGPCAMCKAESFDGQPAAPSISPSEAQSGLHCQHCGHTYPGINVPCPKCGKRTAQKLVRLSTSSQTPPTPRKIVRSGFGEFEMSTLAEDECVMASGLRDGGWVVVKREAAQTPPSETAQDKDSDCPRCHKTMNTRVGDDPTKYCDHCAQELVEIYEATLRSSGMPEFKQQLIEIIECVREEDKECQVSLDVVDYIRELRKGRSSGMGTPPFNEREIGLLRRFMAAYERVDSIEYNRINGEALWSVAADAEKFLDTLTSDMAKEPTK